MRILSILILLSFFQIPTIAQADDKANYYYPPISSIEQFDRKINNPPKANRAVRTEFVTSSTASMLQAPYTPPFSMFAKGVKADKLILIALNDDVFKTLFRARAVLAQFTANARKTPFFVENGLQIHATFLDLLAMMDFKSITISDGETWTHQIIIKQ